MLKLMMNKRAKKQDLAEKPQSVLAAALSYLDRRGYTAAELRQKLLARGADEEAVEAAIARLIELRYLNERRQQIPYLPGLHQPDS